MSRRRSGGVVAPGQKGLDVARRLAQPLAVLDERDADETLAVLAKTDPRRHRDIGAFKQELGKGEAADRAKRRRDRRPGEHRRLGLRHLPAGLAQPVDHYVAARLIARAGFGDAVLRAVQGRRRRHLDRGEGAVIEIGLDPRQSRDQPLVADGKADAPAGHRIGLAERGEFDRDVARPRHFEDRRRRLAVEIDFGIGEVGQDDDVVTPAERDDLAVEIEIDGLRRRVRREVQYDRQRRRDAVPHRLFQFGEKVEFGADRHVPHRGAGHDEAEGVDRIARVRHQHDVARPGNRLRQIGEPLLRPQRDDDLALGIDLDIETAGVVAGAGAAQPGDAARYRIAVSFRVLHRLDQLGDDVRGGRAVGIAHAEIDHVAPRGARLGLQRVDFAEDVRGKTLDAVKILGHGGSTALDSAL